MRKTSERTLKKWRKEALSWLDRDSYSLYDGIGETIAKDHKRLEERILHLTQELLDIRLLESAGSSFSLRSTIEQGEKKKEISLEEFEDRVLTKLGGAQSSLRYSSEDAASLATETLKGLLKEGKDAG